MSSRAPWWSGSQRVSAHGRSHAENRIRIPQGGHRSGVQIGPGSLPILFRERLRHLHRRSIRRIFASRTPGPPGVSAFCCSGEARRQLRATASWVMWLKLNNGRMVDSTSAATLAGLALWTFLSCLRLAVTTAVAALSSTSGMSSAQLAIGPLALEDRRSRLRHGHRRTSYGRRGGRRRDHQAGQDGQRQAGHSQLSSRKACTPCVNAQRPRHLSRGLCAPANRRLHANAAIWSH